MPISEIKFASKEGALSPGASKKLRRGMERDGVVVLRDLFPMPLLGRLRAEVLRRHDSGELRERGLVRDIGGRYAAVLPFEGVFLNPRFYASPLVLEMMGALLGPDFCIGSLEAVISLPGSSRQHQHIDGPIRFDRSLGKTKRAYRGDLSDLPPFAVTLCVPLCDITEDNGPTAVWLGSHRAALRARPPGPREILRKFPEEHIVGEFGRSFLFDFRAFHCGLPNYSREPRPLLMFVFTRNWYRDPNLAEVSPELVIARRDLARVPERHRLLFRLAPASRRSLWAEKARKPSR